MEDLDFIGFTYNGVHSLRNLGIYRTSDGSRYNENLTATMTDKTADVPGGDGQYYFGTTFKNRTFTVNYAFDSLTDADVQKIKNLFCGDGIHELIFDETPYKAWSAKVTGTATMKHLAFYENGKRIYKGEGSVTFTCYYPYAHSPKKLWTYSSRIWTYEDKDGRNINNYSETAYPTKSLWKGASGLDSDVGLIKGDKEIPVVCEVKTADGFNLANQCIDELVIAYRNKSSGALLDKRVKLNRVPINKGDIFKWDTQTGIVSKTDGNGVKTILPYSGEGILFFSPGQVLVEADVSGGPIGGALDLSTPRGLIKTLDYNYLYR